MMLVIAGLAGLGAFVLRQLHAAVPLVPPRLFAVRRFRLAALTSFITFVAQGLTLVCLPFFLREHLMPAS